MNSSIGWVLDRALEVNPFGADASVHEHDTNSAEQAHSLFFEPQSRYIILVEQVIHVLHGAPQTLESYRSEATGAVSYFTAMHVCPCRTVL